MSVGPSIEVKLSEIDQVDVKAVVMGNEAAPLSMLVLGRKDYPLAMQVFGDPQLPLTVNMAMTGSKDNPLSMMVLGNRDQPLSLEMAITGDKEKPISASIELLNLPRFKLEDIQKLLTMQVSLPGHRRICFKVLGVEFFSVCYGGEGKVITEPYEPHDRCSEPLCQVDTRPFPEEESMPPKEYKKKKE
jgi:hypothetical protein